MEFFGGLLGDLGSLQGGLGRILGYVFGDPERP